MVPPLDRMPLPWRVILTLLLAWGAARLCVAWGTPIPWMIGPLLITSVVSVLGGPTASWTPLRNAGQWVIGAALGLYFTPAVGALVVGWWWVIGLGVLWALGLGGVLGLWMRRVHDPARLSGPRLSPAQWRATTYFASAIGGASEMTLLAERHGARTDLVAAAHSLRVLMVTLAVPFGMQAWGVTGLDLSVPGASGLQGSGGWALLLGGVLGAWVLQRLGRANPWFMGALLVSMALALSGYAQIGLPMGLTEAAQLVIGVSLGVRFRPAFVQTAPRWLASVALASAVMMLASAAFAFTLAQLSDIHPATLVLATSPGGIAEMAITAKVLALGVPIVTAFQVCRLLAVLVLAEPVYHWWTARQR